MQLGRCGASSVKPLLLYSTAPWFSAMITKVSRKPLVKDGSKLAPKEGRWVNGQKDKLVASSAYPMEWCTMVAHDHADYLRHRPGSGSFFRARSSVCSPPTIDISDDETDQ